MKTNWIYSHTATLFTVFTLFAFSGLAKEGTGDGGGGAGFCINSKCMTMAQAGLKIKETAAVGNVGYQLSSELVGKVREIYKSLPWPDSIYDQISSTIGSKNTFKIVEKNEIKKFNKALKEYRKILKQSGLNLPDKYLTLFAFSNASTTYLLPEFFSLDVTGQALILIHEEKIRSGWSVIDVLKFDIQLVEWLKAIETNNTQDFDVFPLVYYAATLRMFNQELVQGFAIEKLEKKIGRSLELKDFCPSYAATIKFQSPQYGCVVSRERLLDLSSLDSRIHLVFDDMHIAYTSWTSYLKSSVADGKCANIQPGGVVFLRTTLHNAESINVLVKCFGASDGRHEIYGNVGNYYKSIWTSGTLNNDYMKNYLSLLND